MMKKTINVYINGTDESNTVPELGMLSLANVLHEMTITDDVDNHSICLNGCAVGNYDPRDLGAIFTYYLEKQVNSVVSFVKEQLLKCDGKIKLNAYGFSRGGVGVFLLCQKLKDISPDKLEINVVSLEPVPGNFINAVYLDMYLGVNNTISSAVADLHDCHNVKNMLVLLTNKPLPDIACHAPILPVAPKNCSFKVDVLPGCHKEAELFWKAGNNFLQPRGEYPAIAFHQVIAFLQRNGTQFNHNRFTMDSNLICLDSDLQIPEQSKKKLLSLYDMQKLKTANSWHNFRSMHLGNSIFKVTTASHAKYLNSYHKEMLTGDDTQNTDGCLLKVQELKPKRIQQGAAKYGRLFQAVMCLALLLYLYNRFTRDSASNYSSSLPRNGL